MLNQNVAWSDANIADAHNNKYDKEIFALEKMLIDWAREKKTQEVKIPDFVLFVKKQTNLSVESIKTTIIRLVMRNTGRYYLERISEYYTDQRRHYILCDGFIRNRIFVRNT